VEKPQCDSRRDAGDSFFISIEGRHMRLNKYLSFCGACSRREGDRLISQGRVTVNGQPAVLGQDVTEKDRVLLDGKAISAGQKELFLALNKPRGVVVTTDRSHGDTLVGDLIHTEERVFAVGRLDKESEGLILMTNNGEASNRIQKAREHHEKEYLVTVDRPVTGDFLRALSKGVRLTELNRVTRPCRVKKTDSSSFDIILTEGLNRQIRRMCEAYGYHVTALKRIRVMNILLGELKPGEYRELTAEEISGLKELLGEEAPEKAARTDQRR